MRYSIIQQAFKEITESHKSNITFVTGLEEDIDMGSIQYPLLFLQPPAFSMPLLTDSIGSDTWKIHLETQEQMQGSASTNSKQQALDRTREYLRDIVLNFVYNYGVNNKSVTVGNLTETLDFEVVGVAESSPFISLDDNITGWQIDFAIRENKHEDLCHLNDIFE